MDGHGGSGVTNYAVNQPTYAYTDATTEFDDALLQRGIVTKEQVLLAKGMSVEDAERLLLQERANADQQRQPSHEDSNKINFSDEDDDDDDDSDFLDNNDEDDNFLQEYRQKRMAELQEHKESAIATTTSSRTTFGEVVFIDRTEWTRHVNQDSVHVWVVVCLTSSDTERTGNVEAAIRQLAGTHANTKFVMIPAHSAIPDWPDANLPSLFLYRHGTMQHELIRLPVDLTREQLDDMLSDLTVLG